MSNEIIIICLCQFKAHQKNNCCPEFPYRVRFKLIIITKKVPSAHGPRSHGLRAHRPRAHGYKSS